MDIRHHGPMTLREVVLLSPSDLEYSECALFDRWSLRCSLKYEFVLARPSLPQGRGVHENHRPLERVSWKERREG
ncbi:hypothetical protein D3C87_1362510 [compost metagenome]